MGGLYFYRATAECDACGTSVDVGPFEGIGQAVAQSHLPGWLIPSFGGWRLTDDLGTPVSLCIGCMGLSVRDILSAVDARRELARAST